MESCFVENGSRWEDGTCDAGTLREGLHKTCTEERNLLFPSVVHSLMLLTLRHMCMLDCSWESFTVTTGTFANAVNATSGLACLGSQRMDLSLRRAQYVTRL
jgi:hypothetical protein